MWSLGHIQLHTVATLVVLGLGAGSNVQLQPQQRSLSERLRLDTSNTCAGRSLGIGCGLMCTDSWNKSETEQYLEQCLQ